MISISKELFNKRLEEVRAWTKFIYDDFDLTVGSYGKIYRSVNPIVKGRALYKFDDDYTTWNVDEYDVSNYVEAFNQAISIRKFPVDSCRSKGTVLCFTTCLTTNDGAAIAESNGFFDESDVPPIDTWFYIIENVLELCGRAVLFCWIPNNFKNLAQKGIDVEMMESYFWINVNEIYDTTRYPFALEFI